MSLVRFSFEFYLSVLDYKEFFKLDVLLFEVKVEKFRLIVFLVFF